VGFFAKSGTLKTMASQHRTLLALLVCLTFLMSDRALAQPDVTQLKASQPVPTDIVTLDRAIALAARYNQQVSISREEIPKSERQIAAARTRGMPQFTALAAPGQEIVQPLHGNFFVLGLATQPLTQLYRVGLTERLAKLERSSARESVRLTLQDAVNAVKQTYYAIIQRAIAVESVEEQIKFLQELTHIVEEQVVKGAALDVDLLEVKTRLARAQFEAENLRDLWATSKDELNHLMGRDPRIPFSVAEVAAPDTSEVDMAAAEALALKQRPELKAEQIKIQKIITEKKIILSKYIPDVSVGFTDLQSHNLDITLPKNYLSAGFLLNYDVWDWRRKMDLADVEKIKAGQEKLRLSDTIDRVLVDVRDKCRLVTLSRQRVKVALMARDTARERLRINSKRFKVGSAVLSDVLEAEASLAGANRQYSDSVLTFWASRAEYQRAIGQDI
jgi:outer membrane protein